MHLQPPSYTHGGYFSTFHPCALPPTGIAGLTLGGGIGWLMGSYGLSCDNLLSVDLVTADGQLLKASGAVSQVGEDATAFSHRQSSYNFLIIGVWPDTRDNDAHVRWVRETWDAMQPFSSGGVYVII